MIFYGDVVVRRGSRYWVGSIENLEFTEKKEIPGLGTEELNDVKLIPLDKYASIIGMDITKKEILDIRKKIGYTEVWVIDEESPMPGSNNNITDAVWKKWFFKFIHPTCQKCAKECKQSSRVGLFCNKFVKK